MTCLELLAPARNKDIGASAIDCGADAVYIAGPDFGARKAAGNSVEDIRALCDYAHLYGARIFVTFNTTIRDDELETAHRQMLRAQEAGADAFIIRDPRIAGWEDIRVPLHASTQCAIRDLERARYYESIGCSRIILERELSLDTIREICRGVSCEVEFFVHGALCVCYSGECRLSEFIDGRSADRGECIQACRSLYDLADESGKVLVRGKALLSLKDFNLLDRLEDLAEAGVSSFKIEGRLKNASYVKNTVRAYSKALDALVEAHPEKYRRASFGKVAGGFEPDLDKTFNRGYTSLYLDGKRGKWSSMDAPKSMGEEIGSVQSVRQTGGHEMELRVKPLRAGTVLKNGDGFAFVTRDGITGFRGDVCDGLVIRCKSVPGLKEGVRLFRNINSAFEKTLESRPCRREIGVKTSLVIEDGFRITALARSEDGREVRREFLLDSPAALNRKRALSILEEQLSKKSGHYSFSLSGIDVRTTDAAVPLPGAAAVNAMRRQLSDDINRLPCCKQELLAVGKKPAAPREEIDTGAVLMRSRYCVKFELGLCPVRQGAAPTGRLYLLNNGKRFALGFDCKRCEMTLTDASQK